MEFHHFSDASHNGYGQCSYLRLTDSKDRIHCLLAMSKSLIAPLKPVTKPRLELTAAVVASKIGCVLRKELEYEEVKETYWTDSKTVLGYINNDARRFHVFVGNRVQEIRDKTSPEQWHYIGTKENPADVASRGSSVQELIDNSLWWNGPELLWKPDKDWNLTDASSEISPDDPEVKRGSVLATQVRKPSSVLERLEYFSSWQRLLPFAFASKRSSDVRTIRKLNKIPVIQGQASTSLSMLRNCKMPRARSSRLFRKQPSPKKLVV